MTINKVLVTPHSFHEEAIRSLTDQGFEVDFTPPSDTLGAQDLMALIHDVDAYIAGSNPITAEVLDKAERLKIIARFGVGYDAVAWRYALKKGIYVTLTPGANDQSVADMVFAHLLGMARKIPYFDRIVRNGKWAPGVVGVEIWKKTIGIVGTGRIGKAVARRAQGFDMKILAYDIFEDDVWAENNQIQYVPLEQLVSQSDFITLHTPLTKKTERMVSYEFLERMKPTAYLINTARGKLIDPDALVAALTNRQIAGAALDVFDSEPIPQEHPLLSLENAEFTCHVSSHTAEAFKRMSLMCAEETIRVLQGQSPHHPIQVLD